MTGGRPAAASRRDAFEDHPIRALINHGIPVTLNSDDPVHMGTTIGREYEIAASTLGFSEPELLQLTRNAIHASFTSPERRATLLDELEQASDGVIVSPPMRPIGVNDA